jgi:hypothetical protein
MSATIHRLCVFAVTAMIVLCGAVPASVLSAVRLPATKAEMIELECQHRTAWDLYKAFEQQANRGKKLRDFTFTSSDDSAARERAAD